MTPEEMVAVSEMRRLRDRAEQAEIERNEAREQLAAAVCVLRSFGIAHLPSYNDPEIGEVCAWLQANTAHVEADENAAAVAAFAKIAPLMEGKA